MDVTPTTTPPAKRARTKAAPAVAAAKAARKTLTAARKRTAPAVPSAETQQAAPLDLHSMIRTAAFYAAEERGFAPGRELDDWLEAERRIRAQLSM